MRTTIDLPDALLKEAKAASALRGISLKTYITEALLRYKGAAPIGTGATEPMRVQLPLIGKPGGPHVHLTGEELEQALAESENLPFKP